MWFEVCEVRQPIEDDDREYTHNYRKYVNLLHPPLEIQCIIKSNGITQGLGFRGFAFSPNPWSFFVFLSLSYVLSVSQDVTIWSQVAKNFPVMGC